MYQYSFANVDLMIKLDFPGYTGNRNFKVEGFVAGENLITVARKAPIASTLFGAYGDMVVNMQRIKAGDLVFPVLMNAPENAWLQEYANYFQEQANAGGDLVEPIQATLVDNMGKDAVKMTNGVILAMPAIVRGQTMNTVTWAMTFETVEFTRKTGDDHTKL